MVLGLPTMLEQETASCQLLFRSSSKFSHLNCLWLLLSWGSVNVEAGLLSRTWIDVALRLVNRDGLLSIILTRSSNAISHANSQVRNVWRGHLLGLG